MGDGFKTELPAMQAASHHVYEVNSQIQGPVERTAVQTLKMQWHDNATKLNVVLREIGDGLTHTRPTITAWRRPTPRASQR